MSREEDIDVDEDYDIEYGAGEEESGLFWKMTINPNEPSEIDRPKIEGYIVHVTNACFGVKVNQKSRSVVMVNPSEDNDPSEEAPICVLTQGNHENQQLDLLFNESATITIKGQKPSSVTLTGYLQPPVSGDMDDMDPAMLEDMDEEEIQAMLKAQKRQQMALDDEEEEEPQLIDAADISPPNKRQKTSETTSKSTKNGNSKDSRKRKEAKKTPTTSSDDKKDDKEESKPTKPEKKGKKDKKMQNMKGGIKYRDMKVGTGNPVKHGDKVRVYYVGQLDDKKVFDKSISGPGFEFNYGKGDVIKGWDMGLKGMRVGGKRKLVIPPKLGYGQAGSPPQIGSNATLTFTIEVKSIN